MTLPIPVRLSVSELQCQSGMRVSNNDPSVNMSLSTRVIPFPLEPEEFAEKMAFWDAKYGDTNPPPYPVTSVDYRVGDVELDDLYDTEAISLADIAALF